MVIDQSLAFIRAAMLDPLMIGTLHLDLRILYFETHGKIGHIAMGWMVGCIPDILGITKTNFTEIWHGDFEALRPSTVDIPSIFLPNASEIEHMSTLEQEDRQHFWISAMAFAFFATILVGQVLICLITASKSLLWSNPKDGGFEKLEDLEADGREKSSRTLEKVEDLEADVDGRGEKSSRSTALTWPRTLVAVSFAGNLTASCYVLAMSKDSNQLSKRYMVSTGSTTLSFSLVVVFGQSSKHHGRLGNLLLTSHWNSQHLGKLALQAWHQFSVITTTLSRMRCLHSFASSHRVV